MNKWYPLLKRIIGGLKMYRIAVFMGLMAISIPLGFYLLIEGGEKLSILSLILLIFGVACIVLSIVAVQADKKESDDKYKEQLRLTKEASSNLITEIKGLRGDVNKIIQDKAKVGDNDGSKDKRDTSL